MYYVIHSMYTYMLYRELYNMIIYNNDDDNDDQ